MILAALALVAQSSDRPHQEYEWRPVTQNRSERVSVAPASIERDGDIRSFLVRTTARPSASGTALSISRMQINCALNTVTLLYFTDYRADGSQIRFQETTIEQRAMTAFLPPNNPIRNAVCD